MGNPAAILAALALAAAALSAWALLAPDPAPAPSEVPSPAVPSPDAVIEESVGPLLPELPPPPPPEPVRFLAWGDTGTGGDVQRRVAEAARKVCEAEGCDFVLQLGDNVYPDGVRSETDPQWVEKFEAPYANLSMPFYGALGNHDVALGKLPGAERDNGDFQVRYAFREDRPSDKWRMPGRHYAFEEGDVQVAVLDLTALVRDGADLSSEAAQMAWLDETWDDDATWRIAVSHFPYVSNGKHGNAGSYDGAPGRGEALAQAIEGHVCGNADLYLSGHDHDLQWLKPVPACGATEFVVSGAAAVPKRLKGWNASTYWEAGETPGFFWFEAEGDTLTGRAYDADGNVLFERALRKET